MAAPWALAGQLLAWDIFAAVAVPLASNFTDFLLENNRSAHRRAVHNLTAIRSHQQHVVARPRKHLVTKSFRGPWFSAKHANDTSSQFILTSELEEPTYSEKSELSLKCGLASSDAGPGSKVVYTLDGSGRTRCFVIVMPSQLKESDKGSLAILVLFHGVGQDAAECGHAWNYKKSLYKEVSGKKFVLVCGEAVQNEFGVTGGAWQFAEQVIANTPCNNKIAADLVYVKNILNYVSSNVAVANSSKVFMLGVSMGSWMAAYASTCLKAEHPLRISAMGMHSSGLKIKGDGTTFPVDIYNPSVTWGECEGCKYMPIYPRKWEDPLGLKACVFDTDNDFPEFINSSKQMVEAWTMVGNSAELHMGHGIHAVISDWDEILKCLDDGTGRLFHKRGEWNSSNATRLNSTSAISTVAHAKKGNHAFSIKHRKHNH